MRLRGLPGVLQWVDLRNWAIDCWPQRADCRERAEWVLAVMDRMVGMLRSRGWGSLKTTAGSQAKACLRRQYLTHALHCHTDPVALELERAAYVGGRCECGRLGRVAGPVYSLDVRSMYPHLCAVSLLPSQLVRTGEGPPPPDTGGVQTERGFIAEVMLETEEPGYPERSKRPTAYPIGRFPATLAGPELADACARGRVVAWGRWAEYELTPCLRAFAEGVYAARAASMASGDEPLAQFVKRLLVSIVGKLGQSGWHWEPAPEKVPLGPWCQWAEWDRETGPRRMRALGWTVQREKKEDWANDSVPAIAAWVCSAGRVLLLRLIRSAGWPNVYYCDTDSLHVGPEGWARLNDCGLVGPGALGDLRLVSVETEAEYIGQKHYRLGAKYVCAGLPAGGAAEGPTADTYWRMQWVKAMVNEGRRPEVEALLQPYRSAPTYRVGLVGPDGVVHPIRRR